MSTSIKAQITARIAELTEERDQLIAEANKRIFAYNVTIEELRRLLTRPDPPTPLPSANAHPDPADAEGPS